MRLFATDPLLYLILLAGAVFTLAVGFFTQQERMMPVLNALIVWPFLIWALRHGRVDIAVRLVGVWAGAILVGSIVAGRVLGTQAQLAAPGSIEFNAATMRWLMGAETTLAQPAGWLPAFAQRTGLLLAGSALSAGLIPLIAGARHLAILGLWIANLLDAHVGIAPLASLPPWTLAEIAAQVALGVVLADPIITGDPHALLSRDRSRLLLTGLIFLFLAFILRLLIAQPWQQLIMGKW